MADGGNACKTKRKSKERVRIKSGEVMSEILKQARAQRSVAG